MNCETAIELLPWHLNGTLQGDERTRLEAHLAGCPACQRELQGAKEAAAIYAAHPTAARLVDYAAGTLAAGEAHDRVARHLESCPSCTEELAMVREGRRRLEPEAATAPAVSGRVIPGPWTVRVWRPLAAAASIAAVVGLSGWGWSALHTSGERQEQAKELAAARSRVEALSAEKERLASEGAADRERLAALEAEVGRQLEEVARLQERLARGESQIASATASRPLLGMPVLDLEWEGKVFRGEERPTAAAERRAGTVLLMLRLPRTIEAPEIQLEVLDQGGRLLDRLTARPPEGEYVPMTLPTADLPPGLLTLRLSALGEGGPAEVARYRLQIE